MMRYVKKYSVLVFVFITIFNNAGFLLSQTGSKSLTFLWAFLYQDKTGGVKTVDPIKSEILLAEKDRFKIYIKPIENAYVYVFLLDSAQALSLVFPEYLDFFRQGYTWGTSYHIPEGDNWLYLDEKGGTEEFYLLASSERLIKLEQATREYLKQLSAKQKDSETLALSQKLVLDEIKRLRLENFSVQAVPERPVSIAGNYRGVGKLDEVLATEVKTTGFYAKTVRIMH
jgi:hypothetical protein